MRGKLFIRHCTTGNVKKLRALIRSELPLNVAKNHYFGFRMACLKNHVDVVQLLLALEGDRRIDVHANNERAFIFACLRGNLEVVKILLALEGDRKIDPHFNNDEAFRAARKHPRVLDYLTALPK